MPLSPTTFVGRIPTSLASSANFDIYNDSSRSNEPVRKSSTSSLANGIMGNMSRRPPLPPNHFQTRPLNKIAVIKPNASPKIISRSPSPSLSLSSRSHGASTPVRMARSSSVCSSNSYAGTSPTPRRIFPQESCTLELDDLETREQAPVVFDASLNFVLGIEKQKVRQSFKPTAAHLEPRTASSYLSSRIQQFLQRTDHVMDEWRSLGHRDEAEEIKSLTCLPHNDKHRPLGRSRSATNIMIKGFQYFSRANSIAKSPSGSLSRLSEDRTLSECPDEEVQKKAR